MKTRSTEPIIPFMSMKVDNFYSLTELNLDQGNPPENSQYSNIPYVNGKTGNLNLGLINPIQNPDLLPTESNLDTGNKMEWTLPGYEIRESVFRKIDGPGPMNLQNAYNMY